MDFNRQQLEAINTTQSKVIVLCSAAAGKSSLLAERVKRLIAQGVEPSKIVVFSFTNLAAHTLYEKIGNVPGLYIGTMHAYVNRLLTAVGVNTKPFIKNEQFQELFPLVKQHPECLREVEYLFLDEAQDSEPVEFEFILDMVQPKNWFFVGDIKQSIYRWRGATPDYIFELSKDPKTTTYYCDYNYRNGYAILGFAKRIISKAGIDYTDTSIPARSDSGTIVESDSILEIPKMIENSDNYRDWFVLARTNTEVWKLQALLESRGIPTITFKQGNLTPEMLDKKLNEDSVKVLTIHSSKGLERKNVAVVGAKYFNLEERCVAYVAATRAEDLLVWIGEKKTVRTNTSRKPKMKEW